MPFAIVACSNQAVTIDTWENGQSKEVRWYTYDSSQYDVEYYHENGQLKQRGLVLQGDEPLKDGEWKSYHHSGTIKSIINYRNGIRTGECTHHYFNGVIMERTQYDANGQRTGRYELYDSIGVLTEYGEYVSNVKIGEHTSSSGYFDERQYKREFYAADGTLERTEEALTNGLERMAYYENGILRKEGYLKNDKPDSLWTYYYPNKQREKEIVYHNSILSLVNHWDENGIQDVTDGTGSFLARDYHQAPLKENIYVNGVLKAKREVSKKN